MESKVEKYIKAYTRNCTNEQGHSDLLHEKPIYYPWLTPDHARKAVEIAREEMIEKAVNWLYDIYNKQGYLDLYDVDELKQIMED